MGRRGGRLHCVPAFVQKHVECAHHRSIARNIALISRVIFDNQIDIRAHSRIRKTARLHCNQSAQHQFRGKILGKISTLFFYFMRTLGLAIAHLFKNQRAEIRKLAVETVNVLFNAEDVCVWNRFEMVGDNASTRRLKKIFNLFCHKIFKEFVACCLIQVF